MVQDPCFKKTPQEPVRSLKKKHFLMFNVNDFEKGKTNAKKNTKSTSNSVQEISSLKNNYKNNFKKKKISGYLSCRSLKSTNLVACRHREGLKLLEEAYLLIATMDEGSKVFNQI